MKPFSTSLLVLIATIVAALLAPSVASAATPAQIIRDARDGSIDGTYTAAELRAADAQINAQEREYTDWDYLFQNALRRLANPKLPQARTVPVRDFDGDGVITDKDRQEAEKRKQHTKKQSSKKSQKAQDDDEAIVADDGDDPVEAREASDPDDGDGNPWLIALLIAIPVAIVGVGVWRMQKAQDDERAGMDDAADAPTSSFSVGDDDK